MELASTSYAVQPLANKTPRAFVFVATSRHNQCAHGEQIFAVTAVRGPLCQLVKLFQRDVAQPMTSTDRPMKSPCGGTTLPSASTGVLRTRCCLRVCAAAFLTLQWMSVSAVPPSQHPKRYWADFIAT
jgi:hypothetical protein